MSFKPGDLVKWESCGNLLCTACARDVWWQKDLMTIVEFHSLSRVGKLYRVEKFVLPPQNIVARMWKEGEAPEVASPLSLEPEFHVDDTFGTMVVVAATHLKRVTHL